ncbi:hypothetical protein J3F84DRAFT_363208 [Trichoderma pleuroticola]
MIMVTQHRTIVFFVRFMKQADIDGDFELVPPDHPEFTCLSAEHDCSTWVLITSTYQHVLRDAVNSPSSKRVHTCTTR